MIDHKLLQELEQCLDNIVPNDAHLNKDQLRGFFYAQMITPDKGDSLPWLRAIFYGQQPAMNEAQIAALNASVGAVYQAYAEQLIAGKLAFPFDFEKLDEDLAGSAYAWCQGFFTGLSINGVFWWGKKGEKLKNSERELNAVRNSAKLFAGLATKDFSDFDKAKLNELKAMLSEQGQQPTNDLIAASLFPNVPVAVKTLQAYGLGIMQGDTAATSQPEKKIGRNDPCFCGSGKKYKKCCGA